MTSGRVTHVCGTCCHPRPSLTMSANTRPGASGGAGQSSMACSPRWHKPGDDHNDGTWHVCNSAGLD